MNRILVVTSLLLAIAGLIFFQLLFVRPTPEFVRIEKIEWQELRGFSEGLDEKLPEYTLLAIKSDAAWDKPEALVARSAPFVLQTPLIELQLQGSLVNDPSATIIIELYNDSGEVVSRKRLFSGDAALVKDYWGDLYIPVDSQQVGKQVRLAVKLRGKSGLENRLSVRSRLGYLQGQLETPWAASRDGGRKFVWPLAILLGVSLGVVILWAAFRLQHPWHLFFFYLVLSLLFHFRSGVFFYWDEWHLLLRFALEGIRGGFYAHNEHFVPLFFSIYYFETLVFRDHYQLYIAASIIVHALNALLLTVFLRRLFLKDYLASQAATLLASLFVLNSIHIELTQWAFSQATLFYEAILLSALLFTLKWIHVPEKRLVFGFGIATCAVLAPLCFGNGLALPMVVGILAIFQTPKGTKVRAAFQVTAIAFIGTLVAGGLYYFNSQQLGHSAQAVHPFEHLDEFFYYLFFAAQFSGIFRGLGLYPVYPPEDGVFFPDWTNWIDMSNWNFMLTVGCVLSLLLAIIAHHSQKNGLRIWFLAQLFILANLLLPAYGRSPYGAAQSFALRYHYNTLIGLCILLLPICMSMLENFSAKKISRLVAAFCIVAYISAQVIYAARFDYYTKGGWQNKVYLSSLQAWNNQLREDPKGGEVIYPGVDRRVEYLEPLNANKVTVGRYPDEVYIALNYLRPDRYPLRAAISKIIELCEGCDNNPKQIMKKKNSLNPL